MPPHFQRRVVISLLIALGACALARGLKFEAHRGRLDTVQIVGLNLNGGALNLMLDVYNPNSYDLRSTRIDAGLDLEDTHFGDATLDRDIILAARAHTPVTIPLRFTWQGVGAGARALLTRREVAYDLRAEIRARTPAGERPVRLNLDGTVRLEDMQ